jgi:formylglycine-generating enzyme required for sulfatase activity
MKTVFGIVVLAMSVSLPNASAENKHPGLALIPAGTFEIGDHHGFVDPKHGGDETPIHTVRLDAFYMGINDVTTKEYCNFLNSALAKKQIEVKDKDTLIEVGQKFRENTKTSKGTIGSLHRNYQMKGNKWLRINPEHITTLDALCAEISKKTLFCGEYISEVQRN